MKKIKLGDVFEIITPKGKAYLHYIFKDPVMKVELLRVLPGLYAEKPKDIDRLIATNERYMIFFPLTAANKKGIVQVVGYYPPDNFGKPKYMRSEHNIRGEAMGWHIVDTDTLKRELVETLSPEQKKLSEWGIWNDTLLIERLIEGWALEHEG